MHPLEMTNIRPENSCVSGFLPENNMVGRYALLIFLTNS